jgi:hypothetical protein
MVRTSGGAMRFASAIRGLVARESFVFHVLGRELGLGAK